MISSENKLLITDQNEEVKKLQDLVKKLELQNDELRRKQSVNEYNVNEQQKTDRTVSNVDRTSTTSNRDESEKQDIISLDSIDIIDVKELEELSDEDTWLFSPPRELTPEQRKLSPYKWLRSDIDNPNDVELQSVRKALVDRLDEIIRVSPFSTPNTSSIPNKAHSAKQSRFTQENKSNHVPPRFSSDNHVPDIKPLISNPQIDTRTFTRPKKRKELLPLERITNHFYNNNESDYPVERLLDVEAPSEFDDLCSIESSMTASGLYKFHGVEEVQELARMQEESLRLSSSPVPSPKHSSGSSSREHLSYHVTEDGMYINHVNVGEYAHSHRDGGFNEEKSDSFNLSANSSPSESSTMLAYHSHRKTGDSLRRSLPNLRKGLPEMQRMKNARHPSESGLQQHLARESSMLPNNYGASGLKQPNVVRRDSHPLPVPQAVSSLRSNSATRMYNTSVMRESPPREIKPPQQICTPPSTNGQQKSSLPKPASRLPTPKGRSGLPVAPSKSPQVKQNNY